jgi:F0F1-type ATP synthase membrane subunit b/b'
MLDVVQKSHKDSMAVVERSAAERARLAEERAARAEQERVRAEERAEQSKREALMQIERERNKPTDTQQVLTGVSTLVSALKPSDAGVGAQAEARASKEALDQARQEIQRLIKSHADEMSRLQKDNADTLRRLQEDHRAEMARRQEQERNETERAQRQHQEEMRRQEERLKENLERAERRAEEAERKAEARVQEAETRAERRIGELRDEHRRVLDDLRTQHQQRLDDERRQHDRDLKQQAATFETRLAGQKDMLENRLSTVAAEVTRVNAEADRWRKEAEDNKDLSKQIEKAERAASALGWAPNQGAPEEPPPPKDWKEMLGRIGMDLVGKLPEIVQSAGDTVTKLRGPGGPTPAQVQQMQYDAMMQGAQQSMARQLAGAAGPVSLPPPMRTASGAIFQPHAPLRFGTEDSSAPLDPSAPQSRGYEQFDMAQPPVPPPPTYQAPQGTYQPPQYAPPYQPAQYPAPQQAMVAPQGTYQPPVPAPVAPPPGAPPPQGTYQPAAAPAPAQVPAGAVPQAPPGAVPNVIPPEMIIQFAPVLEQALASGEPVESIAQELLPLLGRQNLAAVVNGLKPERVVVELQKAGKGSSALVRRSGQQFLRDLWAECAKLLANGG